MNGGSFGQPPSKENPNADRRLLSHSDEIGFIIAVSGRVSKMSDPGVANRAPDDDRVTAYDEANFALYLRLLDASDAGANPKEMCRVILGRDPDTDPESMNSLNSHLSRARWMCEKGYKFLLASPK